jgi:exopolysaccharide biosynthesis polyprenyl glycosylphosphotransferase
VDYNGQRLGLIFDVIIIEVSFFLSAHLATLIKGQPVFQIGDDRYLQTLLVVLMAWLSSLLMFGEYPGRRLSGIGVEIWAAVRVNVLALVFFALIGFVFKVSSLSRLFILVYVFTTLVLMVLTRIIVRLLLYSIRRQGWDSRTRIIVGDGPSARKYLYNVIRYKKYGIRVVGYLAEEPGGLGAQVRYLGNLESLADVLSAHKVDGVVCALPVTHPRTEYVIQQCEIQGVSVELILDSLSSRIATSRVIQTGDLSRLVLSPIPHTPLALAMKRITDVVISAIGLVLTSPLFVIIGLAIKLDDGGPVFFSQERAGLHGRTFKMYKFRSMVVDAEQRRNELLHLNEMSGPVFKVRNDPRVTRVGRFLRKTSLDELPQLWNVLKGDMSLVGPRPPLPSEVDQYDYHHRRRLSVKPGITCLWQISGRNNIDFDRWMDLDMAYIDNWSYWQDWKIIFRTIPAVLKRDGAS